jgi:NADPH-dependent 7-cyano-7-deazaguanine reductase QueF-like protein
MSGYETLKFKHYAESLLENIADELNVKEIHINTKYGVGVYKYDTIKQKGVGIDDYALASEIFTGDILKDMDYVRQAVTNGLKQRSEAKIKVRQPLQSIAVGVR